MQFLSPTFPDDAMITVRKEKGKIFITVDNRDDIVEVMLDEEKTRELIELLQEVLKDES